MLVLVSYDISDTKKRTKLAKKLLDFGPRVQYSVFEADINPSELDKLHVMLKKIVLDKDDSIRVYRLCESCKKDITLYGRGEVTEDKDYYIM